MFGTPKYISNSFNIVFPRQATIRRKAGDFEDKLKGLYFQPQIIPVPDELDPEVPRIIFGSEHGFSQIVISQVSIVLNVPSYSPDYQTDISKGREYLNERTAILFDLLHLLEDARPYFCGLSTRVHLSSHADDAAVLSHIAKALLKNKAVTGVYDLQFKRTSVESGRFFSNVTIANYRAWKTEGGQQGILQMPVAQASERGIEIVGDFNDRYSFNESEEYRSNIDVARTIIDSGVKELEKVVTTIGGAST